ncbi:MAG: 50S ribosomal protein L24 [Flavobacteriales bacterium]
MNKKFHIHKGDLVKVTTGVDKGKEGKVIKVLTKKDRALVEGVNIVSKHIKPSPTNPQGGIVKTEAAIHVSNLMVIDGKGNVTRIGRRRDKDGKLERYSKKSNEAIKS